MHRFLLIIAVCCLALGFVFYLSAAWTVVGEIRAAWQFKPLQQPYTARVVGFEKRYGRRPTTAPIVEVEFPGKTAFRFSSSRYSMIQTIALSERVKLVTRPSKNILGQPSEELEIDDTYHLWLGDFLALLWLPGVIVASWTWARFGSTPQGRYTLPP